MENIDIADLKKFIGKRLYDIASGFFTISLIFDMDNGKLEGFRLPKDKLEHMEFKKVTT